MQQIKIVYLCTNSNLAGAPLHLKHLLTMLDPGMQKVSLAFGEEGPVKSYFDDLGIRTYVIPTLRSSINPFQDYQSIKAFKKIIAVEQPDLIHCHSSKAGLVGRIAGSQKNIPVVYTVHGWGFGPGRRQYISSMVKLTERALKAKTDAYIAVSDFDRQLGIRQLGLAEDRIQTIHNGVSFEISNSTHRPEEAHVVMIARNAYQKGYSTLANALAKSEFSSARFVGAGTDEPNFVAEMSRLVGPQADKIEFLGQREDVSALLEASSIFVLSSRFEGLPLSIIEAMSKGLPIVASNVGGIPELVEHGVNGFLVPPGDASEMALCMNQLSADRALRLRMGAESLRRYQAQFRAEKMAQATLAVYEKVLGITS